MSISVLIPVYNRPEHLRMVLAALAGQTRLPDEVVVADDGSDPACCDAMRRVVDASGLNVRMVWLEREKYCPARVRNQAILASTGEYLVFLDCDIVPLPDMLAAHVALSAPRHVLLGNCAYLDEETTRMLMSIVPAPSAADWEQAWAAADHAVAERMQMLYQRQLRLRRWHVARPHKPKLLSGHFSLYREDIFRVNGFDENFVGWGYEDDDLVRRLYKAGMMPRSVMETARVIHLWHPSLAPQRLKRRRDRPNRAYFRRWFVPAYARNGLVKDEA